MRTLAFFCLDKCKGTTYLEAAYRLEREHTIYALKLLQKTSLILLVREERAISLFYSDVQIRTFFHHTVEAFNSRMNHEHIVTA